MSTEYTDIMFKIFWNIYNSYKNSKFKMVPFELEEYLSDTAIDSTVEIYFFQRNVYRN